MISCLSTNLTSQNANRFYAYQSEMPSFNLNLKNTFYSQLNRTILTDVNLNQVSYPADLIHPAGHIQLQIQLPLYTQGFFCDFEDHINRNRKLRIDFGVK